MSTDTRTRNESEAGRGAGSMSIEERLASIDNRLAFLTREIEEQSRSRRERNDLMADLGIVGGDVYKAAITEFDQIAPYFDSDDAIEFMRRLLRNVRTINQALAQVESVAEFTKDATPLAMEAFHELTLNLDAMDRKGYFEFGRELLGIVDTIVTSFTIEDARALRESVVSIVSTVKNMTQPEMLAAMNNAVSFYGQMGVDVDEEVSTWDLLKELNSPEARRGMAFMVRFMKNVAAARYASSSDSPDAARTNEGGSR
ncbi:MAG: DUF1641 domain-containing protein [Gemmatimonadetes bacterium]|nr:DUF1641 domain-containing protein [Gemmatimonadota bacterium]